MGLRGPVLLAALLGTACVSSTTEQPRASFTIAGKLFNAPIPSSYCAEGEGIERYRRGLGLLSADVQPQLVMMKCANGSFDLFDFYSARQIDRYGTWPRRSTFLATLGGPATTTMSSSPEIRNLEDRLGDVLNTTAKLDGKMQQIGSDRMCVYSVAVIHAKVATDVRDILLVGCTTILAGRVVELFHYKTGHDRASAATMLANVKKVVVGIAPSGN